MKKSLTIIVLAALQYGCAGQPATPENGESLIGFNEIASEISVSHRKIKRGEAQIEPIVVGSAQ